MAKKKGLKLDSQERRDIGLNSRGESVLRDIPASRYLKKTVKGAHADIPGRGCIEGRTTEYTLEELTDRSPEEIVAGPNYKECNNLVTKIQRRIVAQMKIPYSLLRHYSDGELETSLSFVRSPISNATLVDYLKLSTAEKKYVLKKLRAPIAAVLRPFAEEGANYRAAYTRVVEENICSRQRYFQMLRQYAKEIGRIPDTGKK
jgi:hypothetical protein